MIATKRRRIGTCHTPPKDKRAFAKKLGDDLVKHRGKKKFYSIAEVHSSLRRLTLPYDLDCWGFALYSSRSDFDRHHRSTREECDYDSMRGEMIDALAEGAWSIFDIDLSWLEWPDIDLSSIFDFIDIG
jgi:hypothetical protein